MTTYKYKAISQSGVEISGVISARDKTDAVIQLKETCQTVLSLKETPDSSTDISEIFKGTKKIKDKQLALICKQFSIILSAGLPIVKTVELVANQAEDKDLHRILKDVAEDVGAGFSMADSFARHGKQLPQTFTDTIRAGEESGALEQAFERLAAFFTKKHKTHSKVISSLTYPAFVLAVAVIVIVVIMVYAVPKFTATFSTMGINLPWPTRLLISASDFFSNYFWIILLVFAGIVIAIRIFEQTEKGRVAMGKFRLKMPVIGRIRMMSACSQFASTLSTMLASGLPVMRALGITANTLSNYYLAKSVDHAAEGVESGYRIGQCMLRDGAFPELLSEMTAVGEESGSIEETLQVIGEYYDNEVETSTQKAVTLLEPIIICILAVFVLLILLAVYLPMFSMYDSI